MSQVRYTLSLWYCESSLSADVKFSSTEMTAVAGTLLRYKGDLGEWYVHTNPEGAVLAFDTVRRIDENESVLVYNF